MSIASSEFDEHKLAKALSQLGELRWLFVQGAPRGKRVFESIGSLPKLVQLDISNTDIEVNEFVEILSIKSLESLAIANCNIPKESILDAVALPSMTELGVSPGMLSVDEMKVISKKYPKVALKVIRDWKGQVK